MEYIIELDDSELCAAELLPYGQEGGVYFVRIADFVKIGLSRSVNRRLHNIVAASPFPVKPVAFIHCENLIHARTIESAIHRMFDSHRVRGEWFSWSDKIALYVAEHARPWPRVLDTGAGSAGRKRANAKREATR